MKKLMISIAASVALSGCATQHEVVAQTPRSIEIHGLHFGKDDNQKAFTMAETACLKFNRHASLVKSGGTKLEAFWNFDCVN